jgi:hypothetical protein
LVSQFIAGDDNDPVSQREVRHQAQCAAIDSLGGRCSGTRVLNFPAPSIVSNHLRTRDFCPDRGSKEQRNNSANNSEITAAEQEITAKVSATKKQQISV